MGPGRERRKQLREEEESIAVCFVNKRPRTMWASKIENERKRDVGSVTGIYIYI